MAQVVRGGTRPAEFLSLASNPSIRAGLRFATGQTQEYPDFLHLAAVFNPAEPRRGARVDELSDCPGIEWDSALMAIRAMRIIGAEKGLDAVLADLETLQETDSEIDSTLFAPFFADFPEMDREPIPAWQVSADRPQPGSLRSSTTTSSAFIRSVA